MDIYIYIDIKTYWEENKFYFTATCSAMAGVYIYRERVLHSQIYLGKTDDLSPHSKLPEHRVNSSLFNAVNESPFETVN